ncbi:MAG: metal-dependent transcriptional regulator [Saprospiraceae bacterium]
MASQTVENYLKALLALGKNGKEVNVSALSSYLEVSKPSASAMVKSLHAQGLVNYQRYKPLSLTDSGSKAAALVVRKHRLTEMYLVEKMGFGWEEVHDIAEQIEHIDSSKFFERMDELLGHPTSDPHGSPIPTAEGVITRKNYATLADASAGDALRLKAVSHETSNLLSFLNRKGIALGTAFEVQNVEPFDGSVDVIYGTDKKRETLSREVSQCLLVE